MTSKNPVPLMEGIPECLHATARQRFNDGDMGGFFVTAGSDYSMLLFYDNRHAFKRMGLFEKACLHAWSRQKHSRIRLRFKDGVVLDVNWGDHMKNFLREGKRAKFLAASDPLPEGERITVYRGVGKDGDERGVSWTTDINTAKFFARETGQVYRTEISKSEIIACIHESGRNEHEVLLLLSDTHPVAQIEEGEFIHDSECPLPSNT